MLVENPDGAVLWASDRILSRDGFKVVVCSGPGGEPNAFPGGGCLLAETGRCPLAERADVVVFGLGLGGRDVLSALRDRYPETPLVIDAPDRELAPLRALTGDFEPVPYPPTGPALISAVRRAIARANPAPAVSAGVTKGRPRRGRD